MLETLLYWPQGQTPHPPLTDLGRKQATAASEALIQDARLNDVPLHRLVTSDVLRATETADIVAGHVVSAPCPWRDEDLLARCLIGPPATPRGPLSVRC